MTYIAAGAAQQASGGTSRGVLAVAAAWVLSLGFDLLLHGGGA